jgi:hypothetical protein
VESHFSIPSRLSYQANESAFGDFNKVDDFPYGTDDLGGAVKIHRLVQTGETECLQDSSVFLRSPDGASDQSDLDGFRHVYSLGSGVPTF